MRPEKTASSRSSISVFSLKTHQSNSPVHSRLRGSTFAHGLSWSLPMERLTLHTRGLALLAEKGMAPSPSGSAPAGPRRRASHLRGPGRGRERRALQRHRHQRRGARSPRPRPRARHLTASGPALRSSRRAALPAPPRAARKRKRGGGRGAPQALGRRARAEPAPRGAEELGGRSGGARAGCALAARRAHQADERRRRSRPPPTPTVTAPPLALEKSSLFHATYRERPCAPSAELFFYNSVGAFIAPFRQSLKSFRFTHPLSQDDSNLSARVEWGVMHCYGRKHCFFC